MTQRSMDSSKQSRRIVLVSILLSILVIELLARAFFDPPDPYAYWKSGKAQEYTPNAHLPNENLEFIPEQGLPGVAGQGRFSTNSLGFRGDSLSRNKPPGEFRVFLVGGSTFEGLYLDNSESVDRRLQSVLNAAPVFGGRAKVYGAGASGARSFDNLALIAHRLVHLHPDAIVLLTGANDLRSSAAGFDYLLPPVKSERPNQVLLALTELRVMRAVWLVYHRVRGNDMSQTIYRQSKYSKAALARKALPLAQQLPELDLRSFEENIQSIIGIAQRHHIPLILLTQPTTWNTQDSLLLSYHWMNATNMHQFREAAMDSAMESYNAVLRRMSGSQVAMIDLSHLLPKSSRFFYDDMHFNEAGAEEVASLIGRKLLASRSNAAH